VIGATVHTVPGTGLVASCGEGVLLVATGDPAHDITRRTLLDTFTQVCGAGRPESGALPRRLIAAVISLPPTDVPSFAAAATSTHGLDLLLVGDVVASWPEGGDSTALSGRQSANWVEHLVPAEAGWLALTLTGAATSAHPLTDLREGVALGDGVLVELRPGAGPERTDDDDAATEEDADFDTAERAPLPDPLPREGIEEKGPLPFDSVSLFGEGDGEGVEAREPLPVAGSADEPLDHIPEIAAEPAKVRGVRCFRGHFNHPNARYCAVCGAGFDQGISRVADFGPRPPLGVLVIDDGSAFVLDTDYVVGREPELDAGVAAGLARALTLVDQERSVSRTHADIKLEGWEVVVSDRGSANGTFVLLPGAQQWSRLPPGQPFRLPPGARVGLGRRSLLFESHHLASS
jgi:hypothetical protein